MNWPSCHIVGLVVLSFPCQLSCVILCMWMVTTTFCCDGVKLRNPVMASFSRRVGGLVFAARWRTRAHFGLATLRLAASFVVVAILVVNCTHLVVHVGGVLYLRSNLSNTAEVSAKG